MRLKVDRKADALYLRLSEAAIVDSEEVRPGVILDFDRRGRVVGVELMGIGKRVKGASLREVVFETV